MNIICLISCNTVEPPTVLFISQIRGPARPIFSSYRLSFMINGGKSVLCAGCRFIFTLSIFSSDSILCNCIYFPKCQTIPLLNIILILTLLHLSSLIHSVLPGRHGRTEWICLYSLLFFLCAKCSLLYALVTIFVVIVYCKNVLWVLYACHESWISIFTCQLWKCFKSRVLF